VLARFPAIASRASPALPRQFLHVGGLSARGFLCLPRARFRHHVLYSCGFAQCGL